MSAVVAPADAAGIARGVELLRAGELVAFPTETVYGLGADAANDGAVRRIFEAKGRPPDHPLIVHLADIAAMDDWAIRIPEAARTLAKACWPGPLTLILHRAAHVSDLVTGGQSSVGLRVPSHPVARALLAGFGGGIAAPSANRFGHVSPTTAQHVAADLASQPAIILDGGACEIGIESTIVAFTGAAPALLRPGAIGASAIARILGRDLAGADSDSPRASGTLALHYAPRTPASLVSADALRAELAQLEARDEAVAVLARTVRKPDEFIGTWIEARRDSDGYAHDLYMNLRTLDASHADAILIEGAPDGEAWIAVRDRLARATAGLDDDRD
jgi:L-threonylcarbamoyladenylate synthase